MCAPDRPLSRPTDTGPVGACCSYLLLICFAHRPALTAIGVRYDTGLVRVWVVATANLAALVGEDREETARATRARETGRALYDRPVRAPMLQ